MPDHDGGYRVDVSMVEGRNPRLTKKWVYFAEGTKGSLFILLCFLEKVNAVYSKKRWDFANLSFQIRIMDSQRPFWPGISQSGSYWQFSDFLSDSALRIFLIL